MSFLAFALVFLAAVSHATWNFFVKRIDAGAELVWLFSVVSVLLYLPLAVFVALDAGRPGATQAVFMAGSAGLHLVYFLLLQVGYRKGDLSLVYPTARATGPVLSVGFAVLVLGESVTPRIAVGAAIVAIGVMMLTGGRGATRARALPSLGFGLATGFLIGGYTVWDAYAVSVLAIAPLLLDYGSSLARAVVLAPLAWRRRGGVAAIWRKHRVGVLAIAIFNPLAYILVLTALTFTPVVYVAPIREMSVLFTVLMGSVLLKEGHLAHRLLWGAVILSGIAVLAG